MAFASVKVSAPGSLMLFGEHAVLQGHPCIVCAVSARMTIHITRAAHGRLQILSELGTYDQPLEALAPSRAFRFVLAALQRGRAAWGGGLEVAIQSEFPSTVGLASSAAVTVAVLAGLELLADRPLDRGLLLRESCAVIRKVQNTGSGADAAAAVFGGALLYCSRPQSVRTLQNLPPLTTAYCGYKKPTPEVIAWLEQRFRGCRDLFESLLAAIGNCAREAASSIDAGDWKRVGWLADTQQGLLEALGLNTPELDRLLHCMRSCRGIHGAKISGAGLGDCVIGIGESPEWDAPFERLPVLAGGEGVRRETT